MLHILLTILKIIGIIILAILGILILLLCVVFFVPLRYEINAETKGELETTKLKVKFSWLLHLLSGQVTYLDEKLDYKIRILWKNITANESTDETVSETVTEPVSDEIVKDEAKESVGESTEKENKTVTETPIQTESSSTESVTEESKFNKIKCTIKNVCDKIKMVLGFLKEESHKLTLSRIKKEFIRFLVALKPKKLRGKVRFGMDDPCQTGQILAALSVLYPIYADNIEIFPEFNQKILEGDAYLKGHIRVIHAVKMAFNIIIDKNVRRTIKDIKVLFESN